MQALKLESALPIGKFENGRDRQCIVSGELREEAGPQGQQSLRACDVVEIGHRLACKDGVSVESSFLRAFDFGVPISALDQPHAETAVD